MTDLVYNCGDNQFNVTMPAHHKAHEWSNTVVGSDVINVHPRMFSLLRTTVVPNSILVKTSSFYYVKDNAMTVFPESTTNLTSYIPAGTNMVRLVLVGLNTATNTISVSAGVPTFNSAVTPPPFPTIPTNVLPSALVRLVSGSVTISEKDVSDARVFLNASVGGSGGWPLNRVLTVSLSNPGADYSSIDSALAGASNGDTLVLDSETFTISSTLAINKDITLTGNGTIEGTADPVIDIGANVVTVRGLTIKYVGTGTGTVITSDNNCTVTIDDCKIEITSNSVTVGTGIKPNNGTWNLINNTNISITGSGSKYGILNDASIGILNVNVLGCTVWGLTNDIRVAGNATVRLVGTVITSNTMAVPGSGSIAGWYYWSTSGVANFLHTSFSGTPIQIGINRVVMPSGSSISAGIWLLDASATVKTRYSTLASAIAAASAGDTILIYPGTYSGSITVDKAITIAGVDSRTTTITSSTNSVPTIDITADGVRLLNLTIAHTGGGTTAGVVATDNSNIEIENCVLTKVSGTPGVSYGFWMYGAGSAKLINCSISVTSGTTKRGVMVTIGSGSIILNGGQVDGNTVDLYSDESGATLTLENVVLTNASKSWAGVVRGEGFDTLGRKCRVSPINLFEARLTLSSGVAVTTGDVLAATSVYLTPYKGNKIEIYNGSFWLETVHPQASLSLSGATADKNSDVFVYDNAGVPTLERVQWTNDTTRATALVLQDGKLVKSGDTTRLYCGTIRTTGTTGQCEDSALKRYVWNYYNRLKRYFSQYIGVTAYTYTTASWRQWNADPTAQVDFVVGVVEDSVLSIIGGNIWAGAGYLSLGLNSTTGVTPSVRNGNANVVEGGQSRDWMPALGKNTVYATQYGAAATNFGAVSLTGHILG